MLKLLRVTIPACRAAVECDALGVSAISSPGWEEGRVGTELFSSVGEGDGGRERGVPSLEGAWSIAVGKLLILSEQHFVDCDNMDIGFAFAEKNASLDGRLRL